MAQKTKESKPFNMRMEIKTYEKLNEFCELSGQSKTVAVERAINMYIDEYSKLFNNTNKNN